MAAAAQAYVGVLMSAWSYNALIAAWEPILEPWNLILKADLNTSPMVRSYNPTVGSRPSCDRIMMTLSLRNKQHPACHRALDSSTTANVRERRRPSLSCGAHMRLTCHALPL